MASPTASSILFIVRDPLPPLRADVLTLFGTEMPRYGLATDLVGQGGSDTRAPWPAGGMHVVGSLRSRFAGVCAPLWDVVGLVRALRATGGKRPACIQVRDKIASGVLGRIAAAALGVPFVVWMSFPIVEGFDVRRDDVARTAAWPTWAAHALRAWSSRLAFYRIVLPGARHVFVQSDAMADWLAGKGIPRARMTAVPMGIDADLFDRARITPSDDPRLAGRRVVLYLGRVARARRSEFLLDVAAILRDASPDVLLVIAGDAPSDDEMAWMRRQIAARGLDAHVLLTGWLPQRAALGYAVRAEVGMSPIPRGVLYDVSSPTKLVEYLALGIPAVANDIPDQRRVIDDSGAGLCVPMEAQAFAGAVSALLADPVLAQACAARGPDWVRRHRTYAILGRRVAHAYATILAA